MRRADDVLRDAAEESPRQAVTAVRADDDEVRAHLVGDGVDLLPGDALAQDSLDGYAAPLPLFDHRVERRARGLADAGGEVCSRDDAAVRK